MDVPNPTIQVPVTMGYLLAYYRDRIRISHRFGHDSDSAKRLSFETTVGDWVMLFDLTDDFDRNFLEKYLNSEFGLNYSIAQWDAVLSDWKENRFGDLCHFLSQRGWRPAIRPLQLGPFSSHPAGAFIATREFLRTKGADADNIAPSTPLEPYAITYHTSLPYFLAKLAPGTLPRWNTQTTLWDKIWTSLTILCFFIGLIALVSAIVQKQFVWEIGFFFLGILTSSQIVGIPKRAYYEGIYTFRDLAFALSQEPTDHYEEIPWTPRRDFILAEQAIEQKPYDPQWISKLPRFPKSNESDET